MEAVLYTDEADNRTIGDFVIKSKLKRIYTMGIEEYGECLESPLLDDEESAIKIREPVIGDDDQEARNSSIISAVVEEQKNDNTNAGQGANTSC